MISVAGIMFPVSAYVSDEASMGLPSAKRETDIDGLPVVYVGGAVTDINIVIPKTADGIKRQDVLRLRDAAASMSDVTVIAGGRTFQAVFRYEDTALVLRPLNARQQQRDTDSYYGTVRLKEI